MNPRLIQILSTPFSKLWTLTFIFSLSLLACSETPRQLSLNQTSGFGGTGHGTKQSTDSTSGFGGTGHDIKGFEGTGILGTISAFGSIWVNGIEIDYTDNTPIRTPLSDQKHPLKLGQQVLAETTSNASAPRPLAERIRVFIPIAGQITAKKANQLTVNHQQIQIQPSTRIDAKLSLNVGQYIAINALPTATPNLWQATRLNHNPHKQTWLHRQVTLPTHSNLRQWIIDPKFLPMITNLQLNQSISAQLQQRTTLSQPIVLQGHFQHHQFHPKTIYSFHPARPSHPAKHSLPIPRPSFHPLEMRDMREQRESMEHLQNNQHMMQELKSMSHQWQESPHSTSPRGDAMHFNIMPSEINRSH